MIPDQLQWSLFRRIKLGRSVLGFRANLFTYASPDCEFGEYVCLHRGANIFSSRLQRGSYVAGATVSNALIGKYCSIGQGTRIGLGKHPTDFLSTHPAFYSECSQTSIQFASIASFREVDPVHLGSDVWIGANSLIMGGVSIADGAIIGAGSIVTKNIPAYAIAVGIPARIVRFRFPEQTIESLLLLKWWDKSDQEIKKLAKLVSPKGPLDHFELEHLICDELS